MEGKKKRARVEEESDDDMEEENIYFESQNTQIKNKSITPDTEMVKKLFKSKKDMINVEFLFSEIRDTYFHPIKMLIKPLFEFDRVNISGLTEKIIQQKEVGTVIKTELEEDTGNTDVDILALTTVLNFSFYQNTETLQNFKEYLTEKIKNHLLNKNEEAGNNFLKVINSDNCALLLNLRFINLPQPLVPPLHNCLLDDMNNYEGDDNKYKFDYVVYLFKTVKPTNNTGKNSADLLYYKYEDEYMLKKSLVHFEWKVPFAEKGLEYLENKSEPQYYNCCLLDIKTYVSIVKYLQEN